MRFYDDNYDFNWSTQQHDTEISVVDEDTFTIANMVDRPCCLNFASHTRPGGGYKAVRGLRMPIKTQEEDLFRRSNLPELMDIPEIREHYPLMGTKGLYCVATVNKDKWVDACDPFDVGIVTVPAVVNPSTMAGTPAFRTYQVVEAKVKRILEIASDNDHEVLILGAWGCGVFNNDPRTVAEMFFKYLNTEFKGAFSKVIFGVPGEHTQNHQVFREVLES